MIVNSLVLTEAVLAIASIAVALRSLKISKALSMACILIGVAALFGLLRYSEILVLPELHQLMAVLSSCVALPLLSVVVIWPESSVSQSIRYMTIFSFIAAFLAVILVSINEIEIWRNVCAGISALLILIFGLMRKEWLNTLAGVFLLVALIILFKKISILELLPADSMHLILASVLVILGFQVSNQKSKSN